MRKFSAPSQALPGKTDHFFIGTMGEMSRHCVAGRIYANHHNVMKKDQALQAIQIGHAESAETSEKYLREFEDVFGPATAAHEIVDDVVGAFPNVPAYLAGQPLSMRRKVKTENEFRPLTIVCDLTSSAIIHKNKLARRGSAILALVRILSSRRPVELFVGAGLGMPMGNACWNFWQIDTAPLDLARAAFAIAHPASSRGFMFSVLNMFNQNGCWPYNTGKPLNHDGFEKVARTAFPEAQEILAIPAIYATDALLNDPIKWVRENITVYGEGLEAA